MTTKVGIDDLVFIVDELNKECPWTKSINAKDMCKFTISEVNEIIEELSILEERENFNNNNKKEIESEIGDLFFDALMLLKITVRTHQISEDHVWKYICNKIRRRTPYMSSWRTLNESIVVKTKDDAEEIWINVKKEEKRLKKLEEEGQENENDDHQNNKYRLYKEFTKIYGIPIIMITLSILINNKK